MVVGIDLIFLNKGPALTNFIFLNIVELQSLLKRIAMRLYHS